jgi:hypothetical protein
VIEDVIRRYNDSFDDALAEATYDQLRAALEREDLSFGGRLLCNVLRPQLLSEGEYAYIARGAGLVLAALGRAYDALERDPAARAVVALSPLEEEALAIEPRYAGPTPFSRLDSFFSHAGRTLRFVEYNAETPAGVGYEDVLGRIFLDLAPVRRLAAEHALRPVEGAGRILDTLLDLHREAGLAGPPSVAVVDWADVPTRPEFEILARHFRDRGVPAAIGAPDELSFAGGALRLRGEPVTIVYKRVLGSEFLDACGLDHPLVRALRAGAAIMANPFRCKLLHKKAVFAVLTDERYAPLYSDDERAAIAAHVPWTRRLEERTTTYGGEPIDLLPWAAANRERLVVKPNDDYGGHGVVLGWEADAAAWEAVLSAGLDTPTVVQERVDVRPEPFPVWTGERLAVEPRLVDLDPYVYRGREVHGILTRLSAGGLLNVTAGGGSVAPTFVLTLESE